MASFFGKKKNETPEINVTVQNTPVIVHDTDDGSDTNWHLKSKGTIIAIATLAALIVAIITTISTVGIMNSQTNLQKAQFDSSRSDRNVDFKRHLEEQEAQNRSEQERQRKIDEKDAIALKIAEGQLLAQKKQIEALQKQSRIADAQYAMQKILYTSQLLSDKAEINVTNLEKDTNSSMLKINHILSNNGKRKAIWGRTWCAFWDQNLKTQSLNTEIISLPTPFTPNVTSSGYFSSPNLKSGTTLFYMFYHVEYKDQLIDSVFSFSSFIQYTQKRNGINNNEDFQVKDSIYFDKLGLRWRAIKPINL